MPRQLRASALAVIFVSLLTVSASTAQTARQIAQRVFPSVVLLVMEDTHGQALTTGSGFFVRPGIVVTNYHVIEGAASGFAKPIGKRTTYAVAGIVALDTKRDLALLALKGVKAPPLKLGKVGNIAVGDTVFAVGNPLGLEGTFSQGIVSGVRHIGADTLLQITAPISPGSSGGPILNIKGEVVGVAVASFVGGQNLNFAIPVSYVTEILSGLTPVRPLASVKKRRREVQTLSVIGRPAVRGIELTHFNRSGKYIVYSIRNKLREPVKNVKILFIFQDSRGTPVDSLVTTFKGEIPPRLAKRTRSYVGTSTLAISMPWNARSRQRENFVEVRVLDFQFAR